MFHVLMDQWLDGFAAHYVLLWYSVLNVFFLCSLVCLVFG